LTAQLKILPRIVWITTFALLLLSLASCKTSPLSDLAKAPEVLSPPPLQTPLDPLVWVGGISILGGMVLMTVTRFIGLPLRGALPMITGVGLILLAFIVERYADYILLPTAIASGVVATLTVLGSGWKLWKHRWILFPLGSTRSSPAPEPSSSSTSPEP
jgi:hypothetical protein